MKKYAYIGAGGFVGAIFRYLAEGVKPSEFWGAFPINTLIINTLGCFLLALFLTIAMELWELKAELRLGLATGLLGAFTTFSTFCGEVADLLTKNLYFTAITYLIASAVLGIAFVYLATVLGREIIMKQLKGGGSH